MGPLGSLISWEATFPLRQEGREDLASWRCQVGWGCREWVSRRSLLAYCCSVHMATQAMVLGDQDMSRAYNWAPGNAGCGQSWVTAGCADSQHDPVSPLSASQCSRAASEQPARHWGQCTAKPLLIAAGSTCRCSNTNNEKIKKMKRGFLFFFLCYTQCKMPLHGILSLCIVVYQ